MRKLISLLGVLLLATAAFADPYTDTSPEIGPVAPASTDAIWDVLHQLDAQTLCGSAILLGAAHAGGYYWITGSGANSTVARDNKIYKLNLDGTMNATYDQPDVGSGWGFRDMGFDGTYLYAGCEGPYLYAFDFNGNMVPSMNIAKPAGCGILRGCAYDQGNDRFWTCNLGTPLFCFDRNGAAIWTGSLDIWGAYGMAWDAVSTGGPFLWIYDQSGIPLTTMHKVSGVHTTPPVPTIEASYQLPLPPSLINFNTMAGGCEGTMAWGTQPFAMVAMIQGNPADNLIVYEVVGGGPPPNITIVLIPIGGPPPIPPAGGSFDYTADIANNETTARTFQVWIMVKLPSGAMCGPVLGPLSLTLGAGVSMTRTRTQAVPAAAPAGSYDYIGYVGTYPSLDTVYDSSFFSFTKSGLDAGGMSEWLSTGEAFVAGEFSLGNYPNPFNPTTTIRYMLANSGDVTLTVYDLSGRQVAQLVNGYREAGSHQVTFDGSALSSGVYIYRLNSAGQTTVAKMVLTK